ncbi:FeoA family protein [Dokdonella koreensis]|uniref:FeoA family protein n=1 Tax=Dokdonella koreensis TaxID=323415 RepID=UPI000831F39D|nr:FeoA family protein [Dokdonella koreensis]
MRLSELQKNIPAVVTGVVDTGADDPIARRLRELGFVAGEPIRIVASAPLGRDPVLVQIGSTRFALRQSEAARVEVTAGTAGQVPA